jgi:hypothetical protein
MTKAEIIHQVSKELSASQLSDQEKMLWLLLIPQLAEGELQKFREILAKGNQEVIDLYLLASSKKNDK